MRSLHFVHQRHYFAIKGPHCCNVLVFVVEFHLMNASEQLLEMSLNDQRVRGLAKYFQQIIIANEIESRKNRSFLLLN